MKKYHGVRKIKFGITVQLIAISYLSFCIVTLATSSTMASFHSETGTLEGDISAADTFTESADDGPDRANTESTDDADKPSEEKEAEESEEDENEEQEIDTEESEEDTDTTGDE